MSSGRAAKISRLTLLGFILIAASLTILFGIYWPLIQTELGYDFKQVAPSVTSQRPITPVDRQYGIVIPKIGANAHVIPNVDPFNSTVYETALTKGVAQAKGTANPGTPGNIFLFAHSSENFYYALRYNSVFYLLTKLQTGDMIFLYYKNNRYIYRVDKKTLVKPDAVSYITGAGTGETLTLMTCWPPGTDYERLLVTARRDTESFP